MYVRPRSLKVFCTDRTYYEVYTSPLPYKCQTQNTEDKNIFVQMDHYSVRNMSRHKLMTVLFVFFCLVGWLDFAANCLLLYTNRGLSLDQR